MPTANPPGRTLWLMAAIVLVGLNLRPSMAAVGPLLNAMRGEIALSFGDVSLLTALPVLTLGLGMFFGLGIARRVGEWRSVALALLLIGAASALRLGSRGLPDLLGSAMLAGLGIALIQALMPALIKARFGARTPLCMGLYVTAIMAGAGRRITGFLDHRQVAGVEHYPGQQVESLLGALGDHQGVPA